MKFEPIPNKEDKKFDFTADEVLETLRSKNNESIKIGTAMSDFQQEPFVYDDKGEPIILSDWELNVYNKVKGGQTSIKSEQNPENFPKFLPNKKLYIERSQEINQNMFRFSLDFARLCPKEGEFNSELMAEYVRTLGLIRAHGQEPMLAVYHWPMPKYLLKLDNDGDVKSGAWENPDVAKHFRFYVENVVKFLADETKVKNALSAEGFDKNFQDKFVSEGLVRYFLSINEPINIILPTYMVGIFPPFKHGRADLIKKVLEKLVEAHDIARDQIKENIASTEKGEAQVGIGHNWTYFDGALGKISHYLANKKLTEAFERGGKHTDFLGLQYYFRFTMPQLSRSGRTYGDNPYFGDIYPQGIYENLKKMNAEYPNKEIFITEFGFSDKDDKRRPYWILETVRYVIEALKQGIPIKGMLLWSLVNNFEWDMGMEQKFGIFDESELKKPLNSLSSNKGGVRGWESWRAVAKAIANPSIESLKELQNYYEVAKQQFEATIPK